MQLKNLRIIFSSDSRETKRVQLKIVEHLLYRHATFNTKPQLPYIQLKRKLLLVPQLQLLTTTGHESITALPYCQRISSYCL